MKTFSALLAFGAGNSPVTGEFPHKGQWREALMFSLICAWTSNWANTGDAGDLRLYRAHYDLIVMWGKVFGLRNATLTPLNKVTIVIIGRPSANAHPICDLSFATSGSFLSMLFFHNEMSLNFR